jgi:hypothetical protein
MNVPVFLGPILSGISIYWSSPIYQHKPDPVTGNFDVAADIGVWICAHVPWLDHYNSPPDWIYNHYEPRAGYVGSRFAPPLAVHVRIHAEWCGLCRRVDRRRGGPDYCPAGPIGLTRPGCSGTTSDFR